MNNLSPRYITIVCSALVAGFVAVVQLILYSEYNWATLFIPLLTFAFSVLLIRYFLEKFIYQKITLIYKTIHRLKVKKGDEASFQFGEDSIEKVSQEVEEWASESSEEMTRLKAQELFRREFIGNLSHELKTPIFNIQGYILTLLEGGLEDEKINTDYLQRAAKGVERLTQLLDDLDEITQLEAGQFSLELVTFDIVALAREITRGIEIKAQKKSITIDFKESYERPIWVTADKSKMSQVFLNLLNNAINYGNENGIIEIRFFDLDQNILVEIADDGMGIPEEDLPRIFERFYRVSKSRSQNIGGTGLGLSIVKHILQEHKQTINVRSSEGVGSTFGFTVGKG